MSCETLNRFFSIIPSFLNGNTNQEIANIIYEQLLIYKDQCGPLIHQSLNDLKENYYEIWVELMIKIGHSLTN